MDREICDKANSIIQVVGIWGFFLVYLQNFTIRRKHPGEGVVTLTLHALLRHLFSLCERWGEL